MTPDVTAHPWRAPLARSAGLFIVGFVGWLWFSPAGDSAWRPISLVAVTALAGVVGTSWYISRARAERRWRAAMERYADQELAKDTHPRRDTHARPEAQGRGTGGSAGL